MATVETWDPETGERRTEEYDIKVVDLRDETPPQKGARLSNELRTAVEEGRVRRMAATSTIVPDGSSSRVSADPQKEVVPPTEQAFELADAEFYESLELDALKNRIIRQWPEFASLRRCSIDILWKKSGGSSGGKPTLGKCTKLSGLAKHYSDGEVFVIWIAADHVRDHAFTQLQLEALIYHELSHCGWELDDKTGELKWSVVAHDATVFFSEITRYGAWQQDLYILNQRYEQMALSAANGAKSDRS